LTAAVIKLGTRPSHTIHTTRNTREQNKKHFDLCKGALSPARHVLEGTLHQSRHKIDAGTPQRTPFPRPYFWLALGEPKNLIGGKRSAGKCDASDVILLIEIVNYIIIFAFSALQKPSRPAGAFARGQSTRRLVRRKAVLDRCFDGTSCSASQTPSSMQFQSTHQLQVPRFL
jgi:hypothetical protein